MTRIIFPLSVEVSLWRICAELGQQLHSMLPTQGGAKRAIANWSSDGPSFPR